MQKLPILFFFSYVILFIGKAAAVYWSSVVIRFIGKDQTGPFIINGSFACDMQIVWVGIDNNFIGVIRTDGSADTGAISSEVVKI